MTKNKTKGQALTEFALILPFLLLLLLGIIEGARIIWAYVQVQNATREAVRYAVTGQPYDATGDPWSPAISDADRVAAIKQVAVDYTTGLGITALATQDKQEYDDYWEEPGAFGVLVQGQRTAEDTEGEADYAGKPGLNVLVQTYYNIQILDPIYAAIVPGGWLRINTQVVMQNEGVDTTASGLAPVGLGAPPPPVGGGGDPGRGTSRVPKITVANVQPVETGTTITILLEDHQPSTDYDVYFDSELIGRVTTNAQFLGDIAYQIRYNVSPGTHSIHSELPGTGSATASTEIEVIRSSAPKIEVAGGSRWPAGSPITINIYSHDANTEYKIRLAGGQIGTITTDGDGNGSLGYTIDPDQPEGTISIESLSMDESFSPANTQIVIIEPDIIVQGGTVWPSGTRIFIFLRDHAPQQTYKVYFDGDLVDGAVTTNAIGEAILSYIIPYNKPDGTYVLRSEQSGATIADTDVEVLTPATPFLQVLGGYRWPAGSPITIQLRKHSPNADYDVTFGDETVGRFTMDNQGDYSIAYVIPTTLRDGDYPVCSVRVDNKSEKVCKTVTVDEVPNITVDGGMIQAPGAAITIRLATHAPNTAYDIYLNGVKLGYVITDGAGEGTLAYTLSSSTSPGDYPLESRAYAGTEVIAENTLTVQAPDLKVVSIETPADARINTEIPVTITIQNISDKAVSNQYFDVDLYIDPTLSPSVGDNGLPPGVRKYWYSNIGANATLSFTDTITLWGAEEHRLYVRVDTSGNIIEGNENNNILGRVVASSACGSEADDDFSGSPSFETAWAVQNYGDAKRLNNNNPAGEAHLADGTLVVHSRGQSTGQSNDDANDAGLAFAYQQQQVSGDFDMYVQVLSGGASGKAGLQVRNSLDSEDVKLEWVIYQGDQLQAGQRASSGGGMSQVGDYVSPIHAPVWLRIVRQGNEFSLYYATVASVPPEPADWMPAASTTLDTMNATVSVGVINASYVSGTASTSTFDNFHLCGDPGGALTCGEVKEVGGAVFVGALNHTDNIARGGQTWEPISRSGLAGIHVPDEGQFVDSGSASANSPELQYQVKFATAGRYYIALLGWGPDNGPNNDSYSVHMGLNGALTGNTSDLGDFTTNSSDPPGWIRDNNWYIDIPSPGAYTINLYMRGDGAQVYKIALFTNSNYPLEGIGPSQSECTVTAPQDIPPGLTVCNEMLVNGDFEGDLLTEVEPYWVMPVQEQVVRTNVHYISTGTGFGVLMPSSIVGGTVKRPWLYQQFTMPDWILPNTTAVLDLQKGVNWLGLPDNDPLYFYLRTTSGITLTQPITIATGQDFPKLDPANYDNSQWSHLTGLDVIPSMAAAGYDPANFAGQTLQAYFVSPNPGTYSSEFYLDKVSFDICTMQPLPDPIENSLGGTTRVNQALTPGVYVWAYQLQTGGASGGPVYTTYSIQDGSYHLYNLPPGIYLVYAEYFKNNVRYTYQTTAFIPDQAAPNDVRRDLNLVLP
jgi:hypothetical protein